MRQLVLSALLLISIQDVMGQKESVSHDRISYFFEEIKTASKKYTNLWNKDLYGPMLLIDPQTRELFANEPDSTGALKPNGNSYSGILPGKINIANTAINWNGKRWAMIMLPLPQSKQDRINLLAHELFHRVQPSLGFTINNIENNHLDQRDGRIYLRLELEALKKAIQSSSEKELRQHLTNALTFRKYRYAFYEGSNITENQLELNEGIAEFTGLIVSGRNKTQAATFFVNGINGFFTNPTFVRSFAYYTTPVYGYLLYNKDKNWNKKVTDKTDLTNHFIRGFKVRIPADLKKTVENISDNYNGKAIVREEVERAERTKKLISEYKLKFVDQPHFEIRFEKMNVSFDPRNIIPVEDKGTVYPKIRVTDLWGILTVENGALMSPKWDKISLSNPTKTEGNKVFGEGWILELAAGYTIEKEGGSGNYKLTRSVLIR